MISEDLGPARFSPTAGCFQRCLPLVGPAAWVSLQSLCFWRLFGKLCLCVLKNREKKGNTNFFQNPVWNLLG